MLLAHGSGVDDILMFVIPVGIALAALRITERRAARRADAHPPDGDDPTDD